MSTSKNIDPEDLALYALQSLGVGEAAELAAKLETNAAARQELAETRGDLAAYAMTVDMEAPPASVRARFLKHVAEEPRAVSRAARTEAAGARSVEAGVASIGAYRAARESEPAEREVKRRGLGVRILPWVGWAVAAGFAFTAGDFYRERQTLQATVLNERSQMAKNASDTATARDVLNAMNDQSAMRVTLTEKGATVPPSGRTTYSAEKGVLIFTASNLAPVDSYKVYELWLIPADGRAPIPAGTFRPDAKGSANLIASIPKGTEAKAFGLTVEDNGGSKVPTPPLVMTGA